MFLYAASCKLQWPCGLPSLILCSHTFSKHSHCNSNFEIMWSGLHSLTTFGESHVLTWSTHELQFYIFWIGELPMPTHRPGVRLHSLDGAGEYAYTCAHTCVPRASCAAQKNCTIRIAAHSKKDIARKPYF